MAEPREGRVVHEVDGIQEEDNQLPRWWLATFFLTVVFAFGYWQYFQVYRLRRGLTYEYTEARAQAEAEAEQRRAKAESGELTDERLLALSRGHDAELGAQTFASTCAVCHGARGEGKIGPNLTDSYWLHGGKPTEILNTITRGYPQKGMPAWGPTLGPEKVKQLAAYILSLRGKNEPGGKGPEGAELKLEPAAPAPHAQAARPAGATLN